MNSKKEFYPFNPLDKKNLADSVAKALLNTSIQHLPPERFYGAGIYAIYYIGNFSSYLPISKQNVNNQFSFPIYVGKAIPAGGRKGGYGFDAEPGYALFNRLSEHASSIEKAENLALDDFYCRHLVVDDIWIPLAESLLIEMFYPLWNIEIDGFGNHDPGSGRYNQQKSPWDILHPGREWVNNLKDSKENMDTVIKRVKIYTQKYKAIIK